METNNQTTADEKVAQLLREAALETDSDKLLELYRKIAKVNEQKSNEQRSNEQRSNREKSNQEEVEPKERYPFPKQR